MVTERGAPMLDYNLHYAARLGEERIRASATMRCSGQPIRPHRLGTLLRPRRNRGQ
jgi:hypothetical protein